MLPALSQPRGVRHVYLTFFKAANCPGVIHTQMGDKGPILDLPSPWEQSRPIGTTRVAPCFTWRTTHECYGSPDMQGKMNTNQITKWHGFMYTVTMVAHFCPWPQFWERGHCWHLCQEGGNVFVQSSWNSFGCLKFRDISALLSPTLPFTKMTLCSPRHLVILPRCVGVGSMMPPSSCLASRYVYADPHESTYIFWYIR